MYGPKLPDSDDVLAKWMMLRSDEEGLIRRANMHLPGRQVDPQQVRRDLWRLAMWERERDARRDARLDRSHGARPRPPPTPARRDDGRSGDGRHPAPQPGRGGGPGARRRTLLPVLDRSHRRRPAAPDRRRGEHVDRHDAVQLPPAPAVGEGDGGHSRRRRHPARVQHDRDLRRHHDGHGGHEDLARQPRGGRRLDRACRARPPVRRRGRAFRLRQDHPRHRDGARPAERPLADALRGLDPARPLPWPRRDDPGRVRGRGRTCRGQDERRGPVRARARGLPGGGRVRRAVHRQHDGHGLRGDGDLADGHRDGAGDGPAQGRGLRRGGQARDAAAGAGPEAERRDHARARSRTRSRPLPPPAARRTASCTCSPSPTRPASTSRWRTSTASARAPRCLPT